MTRADVFSCAAEASIDSDAALTLLWHAIAWGAGNKVRDCRRRIEAMKHLLQSGGNIRQKLCVVAQLASTDPRQAYVRLCPDAGPNLIKYLGRSFATKYLYFAGGGRVDHPSLILDSRVAAALQEPHFQWECFTSTSGWSAGEYKCYCAVLRKWAEDATQLVGRLVGADEIERYLFGV